MRKNEKTTNKYDTQSVRYCYYYYYYYYYSCSRLYNYRKKLCKLQHRGVYYTNSTEQYVKEYVQTTVYAVVPLISQ